MISRVRCVLAKVFMVLSPPRACFGWECGWLRLVAVGWCTVSAFLRRRVAVAGPEMRKHAYQPTDHTAHLRLHDALHVGGLPKLGRDDDAGRGGEAVGDLDGGDLGGVVCGGFGWWLVGSWLVGWGRLWGRMEVAVAAHFSKVLERVVE